MLAFNFSALQVVVGTGGGQSELVGPHQAFKLGDEGLGYFSGCYVVLYLILAPLRCIFNRSFYKDQQLNYF